MDPTNTLAHSSLLAAAGNCIGISRTILHCEHAADANMQLCKLRVRHKTMSVKQGGLTSIGQEEAMHF